MVTLESCAVCDTLPNVDRHPAETVALDVDIESLITSKDVVKPAFVKHMFESVSAMLTLFRNGVIKEDSFVELAALCSRTRHVLETVGNLGGFSQRIEDLGRIVGNIEFAARERASCAVDLRGHLHVSTEECITTWRKELDGILSSFNGVLERDNALEVLEHGHVQEPLDSESGSPLAPDMLTSASSVGKRPGSQNFSRQECAKQSNEPTHTDSAAPTLGQPGDVNRISEPSLVHISDSGKQALQRLIGPSVPQDELPYLIEITVSRLEPTEIIKSLERSDDAQAFIDVMDRALETICFAPKVRRKCIRSLYKMCAGRTLLPSSLYFELPGGTMGAVQYRGGSADVLKRECGGRYVAIKALQARNTSLESMKNRFCKEVITWRTLRHPNVLPLEGAIMTGNQFAMVSEWMTNRNIMEFTAAHRDANRFELLADVARGLVHMHDQGMIHGDLKGANILIDGAGHACLADFGLLTITSDRPDTTHPNSFLVGGTCRWMSPELFDPEKFNLKDSRPTKSSDRYAFGMVVYEVLSGQSPFSGCHDYTVVVKVVKGDRPAKPQGRWMTDGIWSMLEHFWEPNPGDRPKIKDALHYLGEVARSWTPSQTGADTPIATSPTWDRYSSTSESTDEGETSSSSRYRGSSWKSPPLSPLINALRERLEKVSLDQGSLNKLRIGRNPAPATLGRSLSEGGVPVPIGKLSPGVTSPRIKFQRPGLKVGIGGNRRWEGG